MSLVIAALVTVALVIVALVIVPLLEVQAEVKFVVHGEVTGKVIDIAKQPADELAALMVPP